jgi:hypothetical protein
MDEPAANPFIVALLFGLRCLVPLVIMLGVSSLLRRWGWLSEPKAPPSTDNGNGQPESSAARRAP